MIDLNKLRKQLNATQHNSPNPEIIEDFDFNYFSHRLSDVIVSCICSMERSDYEQDLIIQKLDAAIIEGIDLSQERYDFGGINKHSNATFLKDTYDFEDQESQICAEHAPELFKTIWSQAKDILEGQRLREEALSGKKQPSSPSITPSTSRSSTVRFSDDSRSSNDSSPDISH